MKKIHYVLGIGLLLPSLMFTPITVLAHEESTVKTTSASASSSTTSDTSSSDTPADSSTKKTVATTKITTTSDDATQRSKRVEALKTSLKVVLDAKTKALLTTKCKPAQTIVETTEKAEKTLGSVRAEVYAKIATKVSDLVVKLKAKGIDTTALEAANTTLQQKADIFATDVNTYQQAMTDLRALDCATDPTAFKAALLAARTARAKVHTDSLDIRTFITGTLKPELQAIKEKLKAEGGTQ